MLYPETPRSLGECDDSPTRRALRSKRLRTGASRRTSNGGRGRGFRAALGEALLAASSRRAAAAAASASCRARSRTLRACCSGCATAASILRPVRAHRRAARPGGRGVGGRAARRALYRAAYLVSGCVLSARDGSSRRRAATLSPAQLVTAPLAAVLAATRARRATASSPSTLSTRATAGPEDVLGPDVLHAAAARGDGEEPSVGSFGARDFVSGRYSLRRERQPARRCAGVRATDEASGRRAAAPGSLPTPSGA